MVAILSPDAIPQLRFTVDEYLTADLPEGYAYELVNGVVQMTPRPEAFHDDALGVLNLMLMAHQLECPEAFAHLSMNAEVAIPGRESVRQPDLALYRVWEGSSEDVLAWKDHVPFLAAEVVSPGQQDRDYQDKREDYWLAGVAEYWIVDRYAKRFTVLRRGEKDWVQAEFPPPEQVQTETLPGLTLDLVPLLRLPR